MTSLRNMNHQEIVETEKENSRKYYWSTLKSDIEDLKNNCEMNKQDRNPAKPKLMITPKPTKPLKVIHIYTFQATGQKVFDAFFKY